MSTQQKTYAGATKIQQLKSGVSDQIYSIKYQQFTVYAGAFTESEARVIQLNSLGKMHGNSVPRKHSVSHDH